MTGGVLNNAASTTTTAVMSRTSFLIEDILHQHNHHQQYPNNHHQHNTNQTITNHNNNNHLCSVKSIIDPGVGGVEYRGTFNGSSNLSSPSDESNVSGSLTTATSPLLNKRQHQSQHATEISANGTIQQDYRKHDDVHHHMHHNPQQNDRFVKAYIVYYEPHNTFSGHFSWWSVSLAERKFTDKDEILLDPGSDSN